MLQWYFCLPTWVYGSTAVAGLVLALIFSQAALFTRSRYYWVAGIFINLFLSTCGAILLHGRSASDRSTTDLNLIQHYSTASVTLTEPLSEKGKSFKASGVINCISVRDSMMTVKEQIIVYFAKDASVKNLAFDSRLVFNKPLQQIQHTGNPGAFDYRQYCGLQGIYFQVFLRKQDYVLLPPRRMNFVRHYSFTARETIVNILRKYIPGRKEAGLAEALLIGYKDDLDKNLVQSYSNTGVVHIIAISGLHVGLIYCILAVLLKSNKFTSRLVWLRAAIIVGGLWLFAVLAGGSASVVRSALMFTFFVTAESIGKKNFVYNSLAASAFLLLCYNPMWLWDAGFLLSYIAVGSIIVFMKPVYHWFLVQNKLLNMVWKMIAISLSAQILTTPVSIYLFKQFPNYFLVTNLVAVPLSSLVLIAEIFLCIVSWIPLLAETTGVVISWLIKAMNKFVEHINGMPFSTWDGLQVSFLQVILLFLTIVSTVWWLLYKRRPGLIMALICIMGIISIRSLNFTQAFHQRKLVIYNIPHYSAIDLIHGRNYFFTGDKDVQQNIGLRELYLKPSRNFYRAIKPFQVSSLNGKGKSLYFSNKKILIIEESLTNSGGTRCVADIVVFSHDPAITIRGLLGAIDCGQIVFDSSNSYWKISKWKSDCKKYGVPCYSVAENGAFILNLN